MSGSETAAGGWVLALDGMGVLYQARDDVADLLVPFVRDNGGSADGAYVAQRYVDASLGRLSPAAFWEAVWLTPALESSFLATHAAMPDARRFLVDMRGRFGQICCISNDIGAWSTALRERFGFNALIDRWFVSSDIGARKPDAKIFIHALAQLRISPHRMIFVDDRIANVDRAEALGIAAIHFHSDAAPRHAGSLVAHTFAELESVIVGIMLGNSSEAVDN